MKNRDVLLLHSSGWPSVMHYLQQHVTSLGRLCPAMDPVAPCAHAYAPCGVPARVLLEDRGR
jgi:hypothetical protein